MRSTNILVALFLLSAVPVTAGAQVTPAAPAVQATQLGGAVLADPGNSANAEYLIKPADIVTLYIIRMPELSREYTVTSKGTIEVPFLGEIDVLKKTSREVATRVANGLRGDFLVDPQVIATVKATLVTHRFFIQGAVRTPGVYNFETAPTLLELISVAGGLNPTYWCHGLHHS